MLTTTLEHSVQCETPPAERWLDMDASPMQIAGICLVASLISLLFTGSVFGLDNHLYHLPIIHRLYDDDQFRNDAFIQSLRHYSSGLWLVLAGSERYAGDGHLMFHLLLYFSRLLSFVGFVCCASLIGVQSVRERIIFCLILCFSSILDGTSFAGHGALFVMTFSHSEVANGTMLLAIFFAARAQIAIACIFAGLTFFLNAFMGVWLVLPLGCIVISLIWRQKISISQMLPQAVIGLIAYALLTAPVAYNILSNPDFGGNVGFDYSGYLRSLFGNHFFVESNPWYQIVLLVTLAVLGWLALSRFNRGGVELKAALVGMVSLYIIGTIVPLLTDNPTILNLHLLRSGVMIHLLVAMCTAALAARWLSSRNGQEAAILGPCLLFFITIKYLLPMAAILIAFYKTICGSVKERDNVLRAVVFVALGLFVLPWQAWQHFKLTSTAMEAVREWETIGTWAKSSTDPNSMFLISKSEGTEAARVSSPDDLHSGALSAASVVFEASSRRRIWVDFKRGAAVMWSPSYHAQWRSRMDALLELRTLSETLSFAQHNDIDYVIDNCQAFRAAHIDPVFSTNSLCVGSVLFAAVVPSQSDHKANTRGGIKSPATALQVPASSR